MGLFFFSNFYMARVIPFKAVRPTPDKVHLVATRSYVSYTRATLRRRLAENPFSFIHVIKPEFSSNIRPTRGKKNHKLVRAKYLEFLDEGVLKKDDQPAFYLYRQIQPHDSFVGIIAGISVDDYDSGVIKIHEETLTKRERIFKDYLDVCNFNAEPVLLTYPDDRCLEDLIEKTRQKRPLNDFSTADRIRHQLWAITEPELIDTIAKRFAPMQSLYIADGHHRSASSSLLCAERRRNNPAHTGNEMYNYIMACLIPQSQLTIYDYNRVIKHIGDLSEDEFLDLLRADFTVKRVNEAPRPAARHEFAMFLSGEWYQLQLKNAPTDDSPVANLDAQILYEKVMRKHLHIYDPKTDARVEFVSGKIGMDGLELYATKKKMMLAFGLYPVTTEQLAAVADAEQIMPPKTTWIEPKLRSGLTIFSFDD